MSSRTERRRKAHEHGTTPAPERADAGKVTKIHAPQAGPGTATLNFGALKPASQIISVDCAMVKMRHGAPEIYLAQLDPADDGKVMLLVVARYMREMFLHRTDVNVRLLREMDERVFVTVDRGEPGYFSRMLESASTVTARAATVDVIIETTVYANDRAGITFYTVLLDELSGLLRNASRAANVEPYAQFVMTTRAFADMLLSWEQVATKERGR